MKVFISWSGDTSRKIALALHGWLPQVINAIEPWMAKADIEPGMRWSAEVDAALEATNFAIVCVTKDNLNAPWLLYEAGASAKQVGISRVVPFLFQVSFAELIGPLSRFQAVQVAQEGTLQIVKAINAGLGTGGRTNEAVTEAFDVWWPRLEAKFGEIAASVAAAAQAAVPPTPQRDLRDMVEELLGLARESSRRDAPIAVATGMAGTGLSGVLLGSNVLDDGVDAAIERAFSEEQLLALLADLRAGRPCSRSQISAARSFFGLGLWENARKVGGFTSTMLVKAHLRMLLDRLQGVDAPNQLTPAGIVDAKNRADE